MRVEVLTVSSCPNRQAMLDRVREALDRVGASGVAVDERVIDSDVEAFEAGMRGSPTVLIDGRDPFADNATPPSLGCRLYPSSRGYAGLPTLDALVSALANARQDQL